MDISFQLYSARNNDGWAPVLRHLAELGYNQVEGFGGVFENPAAFRGLLDASGLSMPSAHFFPLARFQGGLGDTLETARELGIKRLFCPAPDDHMRDNRDADDWITLARSLEDAGKAVNDAGFRFGWHNHDWEFRPLSDGRQAMDLLLQHAPSIEWEIDVAWVARGGEDPVAWIERHANRITTAHIKDLAPAGEALDEDGWADVGLGTINWDPILSALKKAQVDLFVMEHDKPSDVERFAKRSVEGFRKLMGPQDA